MATSETQRAIEAVFRIERARLIAALARTTRDVDRAEELAHSLVVGMEKRDWLADQAADVTLEVLARQDEPAA